MFRARATFCVARQFSFFPYIPCSSRNMAEQGDESDNGGGSLPEGEFQASPDTEMQHEKHQNIRMSLRLAFVEQRLRAHGFKVDTTNNIDAEAAISSGKVIMVLGSEDDIKAEAEIAAQDPDKYSSGVGCELALHHGEVYFWLLRIGDTITYDPNLMRGVRTSRPKRAAAPSEPDLHSFSVGSKVLVPVLDQERTRPPL